MIYFRKIINITLKPHCKLFYWRGAKSFVIWPRLNPTWSVYFCIIFIAKISHQNPIGHKMCCLPQNNEYLEQTFFLGMSCLMQALFWMVFTFSTICEVPFPRIIKSCGLFTGCLLDELSTPKRMTFLATPWAPMLKVFPETMAIPLPSKYPFFWICATFFIYLTAPKREVNQVDILEVAGELNRYNLYTK